MYEISIGLTCMQVYTEVYFEPSRAFLRKLQKGFLVDVPMGSKYVVGITITLEKV